LIIAFGFSFAEKELNPVPLLVSALPGPVSFHAIDFD